MKPTISCGIMKPIYWIMLFLTPPTVQALRAEIKVQATIENQETKNIKDKIDNRHEESLLQNPVVTQIPDKKSHSPAKSNIFRLVTTLTDTSRYSKDIRPVKNHNLPIDVSMSFNLYQILEVNEPDQFVRVYMWVKQFWRDEFLGWNPDEYAGLNWTVLDYRDVWLPDTYLYNSWTYDASGIRYFAALSRVRNESYVESEEWTVLHAHLVIKRKPSYYIINLIVPTTIIALIAMVGFFSPNSSNREKSENINLGIATLLAMSIFLLMVSDQMPRTSDFVPLIGWYLLSIIIFISLGAFLTTVIIYIQQKGHYGYPVPKWVKICCFDNLAWFLRLHPPKPLQEMLLQEKAAEKNITRVTKDDKNEEDWFLGDNMNCVAKDWTTGQPPIPAQHPSQNAVLSPHKRRRSSVIESSLAYNTSYNISGETNKNHSEKTSPEQLQFIAEVKDVEEKLEKIIKHFADYEEQDLVMMQWEYVAAVLDRFFLVLFISLVLLTTTLFLVVGSRGGF